MSGNFHNHLGQASVFLLLSIFSGGEGGAVRAQTHQRIDLHRLERRIFRNFAHRGRNLGVWGDCGESRAEVDAGFEAKWWQLQERSRCCCEYRTFRLPDLWALWVWGGEHWQNPKEGQN